MRNRESDFAWGVSLAAIYFCRDKKKINIVTFLVLK